MRIVLSIILVALYAGQGAWIPFVGLWLTEQGISEVSLSVLFSVMLLSKVVSSPIIAHLSDTRFRPERVGLVLMLGLAGCYATLLLPGLPTAAVIGLVILASATAPTVFPITDRLILQMAGSGGRGFGRQRLWGSVGFAAGTLIAGQIAAAGGLDWVIAFIVFLTLLGALALAQLKPMTAETNRAEQGKVQAPLVMLLKLRPLWPGLIAATLIFASNAHFFTLAAVEWSQAQMSVQAISLIWTVGIVAEIIGFRFGAACLAWLTPAALLGLAAFLSMLRWAALALWVDSSVLLLAQLGQAATISLTSIAFAALVARHVPQQAVTSAFALFMLLAMGPFISLATLASSAVSAVFAVSGFVAMVPLCLLAAVIATFDVQSSRDETAIKKMEY